MMNAYRVHYTAPLPAYLHVAARTREEAVYKAFDELADRRVVVEALQEVYIQTDGDRWTLAPPHRTLTAQGA